VAIPHVVPDGDEEEARLLVLDHQVLDEVAGHLARDSSQAGVHLRRRGWGVVRDAGEDRS